jgi:hypothetical protein
MAVSESAPPGYVKSLIRRIAERGTLIEEGVIP